MSARPTIAGLADDHLEDLLRSGLAPDTIVRAQIHSGSGAECSAVLGYGVGPGMVIPYTCLSGTETYARVKLNDAGPDGKRYRSPKDRGNRLYVPVGISPAVLADVTQPLYVTEGEKKALKTTQEGLPCVALSGVWSWRQKGPQGSAPIPDLDGIAWTGRAVYLVFDSDLATNPDVQRAETALAEALGRRGAQVFAIRLPGGPGGAKVGLDDYWLTETVETFCALEPLPLVRPDRGRIEVIDLADLLARTFDPPRSLVGQAIVIAGGISVGGGAPRIGKSLLCSNLALARTFEIKWLGFDVEPGVTLYLQAEIPEAWLQRRFDTMVRELADPDPRPVPRGRLHTVTRRGLFLDTPSGRDGLHRILDGLDPRPDLVIVDPLARFYAGDENSQKDVGRFVATLDAFVQDYGCAFVIPHHPSKLVKGDLREGGARLRGMSGLWAAADGCWMLTREDEALVLTFEDLRHAEPPPPIYLARSPGLWLLPTSGPLQRLLTVRKAVLGIGLTYTRLVHAVMADCAVKERQAKSLIATATAQKLIRKDAQGLYREVQ